MSSSGTTGFGLFSQDFWFEGGAGVSKSLGIQLPVISTTSEHLHFTSVYADTASLASLMHRGSRDITSHTLAAAVCDAEELCSVSTAKEPGSFFTASPLYFWIFLILIY